MMIRLSFFLNDITNSSCVFSLKNMDTDFGFYKSDSNKGTKHCDLKYHDVGRADS